MIKLYYLPLSLAVLLAGCGPKETEQEDSNAAKADYVAEKTLVDTLVLNSLSTNRSWETESCVR